MRILHVVPTYLPATRYGGPIYSVHGLAKAQAGLGHDVHVFTTNVDGPGISPVAVETRVHLDGVAVTYFPTGLGRRIYRSPHLGRALAAQMSRFDLVHLHSVFLWPTFAAARAAHAGKVPYIVSPRGMLVRELIARRSRIAKSVWIGLIERRSIAQAAAVHVTSAVEAASLADLGFRPRNVIEIANGIEPPSAFQAADAAEDIRAAVDRGNYVLSLGRMNWKKNLPELIRAWRDVPDMRLIVAGYQEDGYGAALAALIRSEKMTNRVEVFARPMLAADKELLFERCVAFVLPSLSENFGNTALEAMARGKAVVVTGTSGVASVVAAAHCGIVCAPEAGALAGAIRRLLADPDELARMGSRGRATALRQYGWETIARQMIAAYQDLLAQARGA